MSRADASGILGATTGAVHAQTVHAQDEKQARNRPRSTGAGADASTEEAGHDAVHVSSVRLDDTGDDVIYSWAERENRVVITADADFGEITAIRDGHLRRGPWMPMQNLRLYCPRRRTQPGSPATALRGRTASAIVIARTRVRAVLSGQSFEAHGSRGFAGLAPWTNQHITNMHTVPDNEVLVTLGVDTHGDVHVAVAVDEVGGMLGATHVPAREAGSRQLVEWASSFGVIDRVGIEGTGSYAAGLSRWLRAQGIVVVDADRPHSPR